MNITDLDMDYYRFIQNGKDHYNKKTVVADETKERIKLDMLNSINCEFDTTRNGIPQKFVVTTTQQIDKMDIIAFPDEDLFIGDIITCYGKPWIVKEVYATNILQMKGKMICCNLDLKFQVSPSSEIIVRPVVIDSGVYSTTQKQQPEIIIPDQQYKMYAQIDDAVQHLYVGKRIATGIWYDEDGQKHLQCFRITAVDSTSLNFYNGHIVEFKLRSDLDNPVSDNMEEMICDYIPHPTPYDNFAKGGW